MRSFTSGGKITKKNLFPQIILSIYSWDLGRQVGGPVSHENRHLGMGASSPKMRIEKRKSAAASVALNV